MSRPFLIHNCLNLTLRPGKIGVYHRNDGQKIFLSQSDYQALIEALRTLRRPRVIPVTGFCRACGI